MRKVKIKEFFIFLKYLPKIWFSELKGAGKGFLTPSSLQVFFMFTSITFLFYKNWNGLGVSVVFLVVAYLWKKYEEGKDRNLMRKEGII